MIRTPPSALARRLYALIQARTRLLTCQEALSHTSSSAFVPPRCQPRADPGQEILGDLADGTTIHAAQQHAAGVATQQPVARQRLGVRGVLGRRPLHQTQRLLAGPGVQPRQRQPRPPGLSLETQHPIGVRRRQADQTVPRFFFARRQGRGRGSSVWRVARRDSGAAGPCGWPRPRGDAASNRAGNTFGLRDRGSTGWWADRAAEGCEAGDLPGPGQGPG